MGDPLVSVIFLNCNRLKFLRNAVNSFLECNEYENVEIVICDNGSTEAGTQDWLNRLNHPWVRHKIRLNEPTHIAAAKNYSRSMTRGDYILDVHEDFQFVARGNWLTDLIDVANVTPRPVTVFYYSTIQAKLDSYQLAPALTDSGLEYFRVLNAGYHDVHFMRRDICDALGPFAENTGFRLSLFGKTFTSTAMTQQMGHGLSRFTMRMITWFAQRIGRTSLESYESEYILRAAKHGFGQGARAMLKYPVAVPLMFPNLARFRNGKLTGYYPDCDSAQFYCRIMPYNDIKQRYGALKHPPTADELSDVVGIANYAEGTITDLHYS